MNIWPCPIPALALAYFVFFTSWVVAYSDNTKFPFRQEVLLIGVVIGAIVITVITMADGNYQNVTCPPIGQTLSRVRD